MSKRRIYIPVLLFFVCFILAVFLPDGMPSEDDVEFQHEFNAFQETLHRKMVGMQKFLNIAVARLDTTRSPGEAWNEFRLSENQMAVTGESYLVYKKDSLVFWSDNAFSLSDSLARYYDHATCLFLGNGWFVKMTGRSGDYVVTGLILIYRDYPLENRFMKNGFQEDFSFNREVKMGYVKDVVPGSYFVTGLNKERLFYIHPSPVPLSASTYISYAGLLYLASLAFLLITLLSLVKSTERRKKKLVVFAVIVVLLGLLRFVMVTWKIPVPVYQLDIFKPQYFASSNWLPSLGDLIVNSVIIFFIVYIFYTEFSFEPRRDKTAHERRFPVYLAFIGLALLSIFPDHVFRNLVQNSRISFEIHNLLDITQYSLFALLPVALLFASIGLLADKLILHTRDRMEKKRMLLLFFFSVFAVFVLMNITRLGYDVISLLCYLVIFYIICTIRYSGTISYRYSTFLLIILVFSLYSAVFSARYTSIKQKAEQKVLAVNLADEHDPVAELLISDVKRWMSHDKILLQLIFNSNFSMEQFGQLNNYLGKRYFNDYWLKYNYQVTVCSAEDSVFIQPDSIRTHCDSFFEDMVRERGIHIPNTDSIYFMDNRNGRISYFFSIPYVNAGKAVKLYVSLDSRLVSEALGYPELLLENDISLENPLSGYSYAKYYKGKLIMKKGSFPYSLTSQDFSPGKEEFAFRRLDRYDHTIYKVDPNNLIVLSRPVLTAFDRLVAFSYVFIFYFALATILLLLARVPFIQLQLKLTLKNRIQYTMIGLLFLSLLLIGGGSVYFTIRQYNDKHREILSEKVQSVYVELEHQFMNLKQLQSNWSNADYDSLEELLKRFSNVFYTDINLYDARGVLLASSRPEIFANYLVGRRMNPLAYQELAVKDRVEYIQREQIGSMRFLSAYVPFINNENRLLAYLNLPYFTRQTVLSEEVSSLVVAVVNISILLIMLSTAFTIFVSNQITRPLNIIQKKFSEIELGKRYEKINYDRKDEIGSLVKEYNRMVEELQRNVELLARSERESAWREMAKQVAHEIKNPLTPMKLSVQHLERAWGQRKENFGEYLKKFINTIIEQIDNLSFIATAFSNFAMMPRENNERIDFLEIIINARNLFSSQEDMEVTSDFHNLSSAYVFGDREQLVRVLVNLFKNAQQSVPETRKAEIRISLKQSDGFYVFSISDNGSGIPENLKKRMFEPNFTTKSSGMGLGLAMSKKIIENAGGTITYKTIEGEGTTFHVSLPVKE